MEPDFEEQDSLQTASFLRFAEGHVKNLSLSSAQKPTLSEPESVSSGLVVSSRYGVACSINSDNGVSVVHLTDKSFIDLVKLPENVAHPKSWVDDARIPTSAHFHVPLSSPRDISPRSLALSCGDEYLATLFSDGLIEIHSLRQLLLERGGGGGKIIGSSSSSSSRTIVIPPPPSHSHCETICIQWHPKKALLMVLRRSKITSFLEVFGVKSQRALYHGDIPGVSYACWVPESDAFALAMDCERQAKVQTGVISGKMIIVSPHSSLSSSSSSLSQQPPSPFLDIAEPPWNAETSNGDTRALNRSVCFVSFIDSSTLLAVWRVDNEQLDVLESEYEGLQQRRAALQVVIFECAKHDAPMIWTPRTARISNIGHPWSDYISPRLHQFSLTCIQPWGVAFLASSGASVPAILVRQQKHSVRSWHAREALEEETDLKDVDFVPRTYQPTEETVLGLALCSVDLLSLSRRRGSTRDSAGNYAGALRPIISPFDVVPFLSPNEPSSGLLRELSNRGPSVLILSSSGPLRVFHAVEYGLPPEPSRGGERFSIFSFANVSAPSSEMDKSIIVDEVAAEEDEPQTKMPTVQVLQAAENAATPAVFTFTNFGEGSSSKFPTSSSSSSSSSVVAPAPFFAMPTTATAATAAAGGQAPSATSTFSFGSPFGAATTPSFGAPLPPPPSSSSSAFGSDTFSFSSSTKPTFGSTIPSAALVPFGAGSVGPTASFGAVSSSSSSSLPTATFPQSTSLATNAVAAVTPAATATSAGSSSSSSSTVAQKPLFSFSTAGASSSSTTPASSTPFSSTSAPASIPAAAATTTSAQPPAQAASSSSLFNFSSSSSSFLSSSAATAAPLSVSSAPSSLPSAQPAPTSSNQSIAAPRISSSTPPTMLSPTSSIASSVNINGGRRNASSSSSSSSSFASSAALLSSSSPLYNPLSRDKVNSIRDETLRKLVLQADAAVASLSSTPTPSSSTHREAFPLSEAQTAAISATLATLCSNEVDGDGKSSSEGSIAHAKRVVESLLEGIKVMHEDVRAMNLMQPRIDMLVARAMRAKQLDQNVYSVTTRDHYNSNTINSSSHSNGGSGGGSNLRSISSLHAARREEPLDPWSQRLLDRAKVDVTQLEIAIQEAEMRAKSLSDRRKILSPSIMTNSSVRRGRGGGGEEEEEEDGAVGALGGAVTEDEVFLVARALAEKATSVHKTLLEAKTTIREANRIGQGGGISGGGGGGGGGGESFTSPQSLNTLRSRCGLHTASPSPSRPSIGRPPSSQYTSSSSSILTPQQQQNSSSSSSNVFLGSAGRRSQPRFRTVSESSYTSNSHVVNHDSGNNIGLSSTGRRNPLPNHHLPPPPPPSSSSLESMLLMTAMSSPSLQQQQQHQMNSSNQTTARISANGVSSSSSSSSAGTLSRPAVKALIEKLWGSATHVEYQVFEKKEKKTTTTTNIPQPEQAEQPQLVKPVIAVTTTAAAAASERSLPPRTPLNSTTTTMTGGGGFGYGFGSSNSGSIEGNLGGDLVKKQSGSNPSSLSLSSMTPTTFGLPSTASAAQPPAATTAPALFPGFSSPPPTLSLSVKKRSSSSSSSSEVGGGEGGISAQGGSSGDLAGLNTSSSSSMYKVNVQSSSSSAAGFSFPSFPSSSSSSSITFGTSTNKDDAVAGSEVVAPSSSSSSSSSSAASLFSASSTVFPGAAMSFGSPAPQVNTPFGKSSNSGSSNSSSFSTISFGQTVPPPAPATTTNSTRSAAEVEELDAESKSSSSSSSVVKATDPTGPEPSSNFFGQQSLGSQTQNQPSGSGSTSFSFGASFLSSMPPSSSSSSLDPSPPSFSLSPVQKAASEPLLSFPLSSPIPPPPPPSSLQSLSPPLVVPDVQQWLNSEVGTRHIEAFLKLYGQGGYLVANNLVKSAFDKSKAEVSFVKEKGPLIWEKLVANYGAKIIKQALESTGINPATFGPSFDDACLKNPEFGSKNQNIQSNNNNITGSSSSSFSSNPPSSSSGFSNSLSNMAQFGAASPPAVAPPAPSQWGTFAPSSSSSSSSSSSGPAMFGSHNASLAGNSLFPQQQQQNSTSLAANPFAAGPSMTSSSSSSSGANTNNAFFGASSSSTQPSFGAGSSIGNVFGSSQSSNSSQPIQFQQQPQPVQQQSQWPPSGSAAPNPSSSSSSSFGFGSAQINNNNNAFGMMSANPPQNSNPFLGNTSVNSQNSGSMGGFSSPTSSSFGIGGGSVGGGGGNAFGGFQGMNFGQGSSAPSSSANIAPTNFGQGGSVALNFGSAPTGGFSLSGAVRKPGQ